MIPRPYTASQLLLSESELPAVITASVVQRVPPKGWAVSPAPSDESEPTVLHPERRVRVPLR
jgi:hypothetical protein